MHTVKELCELVDSFNSKHVGICYDFGHAHMRGHDIKKDILTMRDRLVATHVADNHGDRDEHLLPFYGTIDWKKAVEALRKITMQATLPMSACSSTNTFPWNSRSQQLGRQSWWESICLRSETTTVLEGTVQATLPRTLLEVVIGLQLPDVPP